MIELKSIAWSAGKFMLQDVSFSIETGQYAVLMGPTGQGKTTLLEIICGLRRALHGQVIINGTDVTRLAPGDRQLGYVPQDLALFSNLNVRQHLEFALQLRRRSRSYIQDRTEALARLLGIDYLMERRVTSLSGGEAQRVALGRAISFEPHVLLLDEPLSALDRDTRLGMHQLLKDLKTSTGMTTLHVTHNMEESEALADRQFRIQNGVLSEVG